MKALVLAETADAARELAAGARSRFDEVVLVCVGTEAVTGVADKAIRIAVPEGSIVEDAYATVNAVFDAEAPSAVYAEPTRRMKALVGRLAAHAGTAAITDVFSFDGDAAASLYFGGVGERMTKARGDAAVFTVSPGTFDATGASGTDIVTEAVFQAPARAVKRIGTEPLPTSDANLLKSDVVVAVGRGFAEQSDLDLARELCEAIGAGMACSRPLTEGVDWMPKGTYVGVSGLALSPKVYLAVGISGQMQHMVGCNRAGTLVAVNKDKNAPVFKQCDYGLVADLHDALPALAAAL